jgi:rubrerythrin
MMTLAGTIKSVETALDLAIHLEMAGKTFYENAKSGATDEKLRMLFSFLIEQELVHMERYKQLSERTTGKTVYQEALFGEYSRYIELLVGDISGKLTYDASLSMKDVLDMALGFEKDTLLFLYEIQALFSGNDATVVDDLCKEEKNHIQLLLSYKQKLGR